MLLTGEYFVLDGALALALPTRPGQSLHAEWSETAGELLWHSYDHEGKCWFEAGFDLPDLHLRHSSEERVGLRLATVLQAVASQGPGFWDPARGWKVSCHLSFPRDWGLGTSSTLISLIAQWTDTDPYPLLEASFGGSGYDLACAQARGPVLFQRPLGKPQYVEVPFNPSFRHQLYFVFLGQKQNSREGIARYREKVEENPALIDQVNRLTTEFLCARDLAVFEELIRRHEQLVAGTLELPKAKDLYFQDFWGEVKSLGAWGGDFVMMTSARGREETTAYLTGKGFDVILPYEELIISSSLKTN